METRNIDPFVELEAMKRVVEVLAPLDTNARARILKWASETYSVVAETQKPGATKAESSLTASRDQASESAGQFGTIAELYAAANPKTEAEKVAVVAYWFQVYESHPDLDSQAVNTQLKHLGHGVSNVTAAFSALMNRKPQYVIQTRKSGTTRQSRKRYLLTNEGKRFVEGLIPPTP